ncbi:hypothetical protein [Ruegeria sp. ANG-S4]|uniref:hypothetical protein n=1 Tax=Ruegeria sp. ANG-S4 TaxID=1577904 RepID=UPI0006898F16|nr:hypothetical protein [Ruegeria sp. ANG-S4]
MAKEVDGKIKLKLLAGRAQPNNALGALLGTHGIDASEFCLAFNNQTVREGLGTLLMTSITKFQDHSYSFSFEPMDQT